jgi:L-fucose mutarotase/ribose pyranase (RbsD/FucU family)
MEEVQSPSGEVAYTIMTTAEKKIYGSVFLVHSIA